MTEDKIYYTPSEAVEYLREVRGLIYAVSSLRNMRRYNNATAKRTYANTTLWTKEELDAIVPSTKVKRVKKDDSEGVEGSDTSVLYQHRSSGPAYRSHMLIGA
jgi:transposase